MPGKAIVAATEEMLMIEPPFPAAPPGRIARSPCLRPRIVPSTLTSSIRRISSGSVSTSRCVTSMPALFTRMSSPPSSAIVCVIAVSQSASFGHVERDEPAGRPSARDGGGGLLADVLEHVADHHGRARLGQRLGYARPEAAGTPGDQRSPSGQVVRTHPIASVVDAAR